MTNQEQFIAVMQQAWKRTIFRTFGLTALIVFSMVVGAALWEVARWTAGFPGRPDEKFTYIYEARDQRNRIITNTKEIQAHLTARETRSSYWVDEMMEAKQDRIRISAQLDGLDRQANQRHDASVAWRAISKAWDRCQDVGLRAELVEFSQQFDPPGAEQTTPELSSPARGPSEAVNDQPHISQLPLQ